MALSKVNAPRPASWFQKLVSAGDWAQHSSTSGLCSTEQQTRWGWESGAPVGGTYSPGMGLGAQLRTCADGLSRPYSDLGPQLSWRSTRTSSCTRAVSTVTHQ